MDTATIVSKAKQLNEKLLESSGNKFDFRVGMQFVRRLPSLAGESETRVFPISDKVNVRGLAQNIDGGEDTGDTTITRGADDPPEAADPVSDVDALLAGLSDDDRETFFSILKALKSNPDALREFADMVKKEIMFIGAENKPQGFINVEKEFLTLSESLSDELLQIFRVPQPVTIESISLEWDAITPEIIVISCHGDDFGLWLENADREPEHINNTTFLQFFKPRSNYTKCVVLSACESLNLGRLIKNAGKKVVATDAKVNIKTAAEFQRIFFAYLNRHSLDNKRVYNRAFEHAKNVLEMKAAEDIEHFYFLEAEGLID